MLHLRLLENGSGGFLKGKESSGSGKTRNLRKSHCSMKVWIFCSIQYPLGRNGSVKKARTISLPIDLYWRTSY